MADRGDNSEYILGRNWYSSARLNLQHYIWQQNLGYILHPSIPLRDEPSFKVADVGTGTGAWITELAAKLPKASLVGIDVDLSQCPPVEWRPKNITMEQVDMFETVPEHLHGQFDVVNLRLFHVVVRNDDPRPLLTNSLKLLKPGGYIQWSEWDYTTRRMLKANDSVSNEKFVAMCAFPSTLGPPYSRLDPKWVPQLGSIMREHGVQVTSEERGPHRPEHHAFHTDTIFMALREICSKIPEEKAKEFRRLIADAEDEMAESGRRIAGTMDTVTIVGHL